MTIALVTGATGQDGWYLCAQLARDGVEIHVLVHREKDGRLEAGLAELQAAVPAIIVHEGDLADPVRLAAVIAEAGPDEIYNLGGISSVAFSWEQPGLTGRITGVAVTELLHAAWALQERTGSPVRVVQASSAEIFGRAIEVPQDETTPIAPVSPYGAAKAYAQHMVGLYRARGLHAAAVILYNHESPRRPPTFVTRKITRAAARIAAGLDTELRMGSFDVTRDWGWAEDYVAAMVAVQRHHEADDFVVATGEAHTIGDFVRIAFARVGIDDWERYVVIDPAFVRPADPTVQLGDASKARRELGWRPTVAFEGMVHAMVDHDVALAAAGER